MPQTLISSAETFPLPVSYCTFTQTSVVLLPGGGGLVAALWRRRRLIGKECPEKEQDGADFHTGREDEYVTTETGVTIEPA